MQLIVENNSLGSLTVAPALLILNYMKVLWKLPIEV